MDLDLSDISGKEVLKEIKATTPNIKIIANSAYRRDPDIKEVMALGADYFLGKPFMPEQLSSALKKFLPHD